MARLIDQSTGEERQLLKAVTLIGRAEYCDLCLPERIVSREHARICRRLTGYYVEDLGSTHGTRVNDVRIRRRAKLHDGDLLTVALVPAEPHTSSGVRSPHTDTTTGSQRTPLPSRDLPGPSGVRMGGSFIFRK